MTCESNTSGQTLKISVLIKKCQPFIPSIDVQNGPTIHTIISRQILTIHENCNVIKILAIYSHGISFGKKFISNVEARTCVAGFNQQPCYPLDYSLDGLVDSKAVD